MTGGDTDADRTWRRKVFGQWDYAKNFGVSPSECTRSKKDRGKKYWWVCDSACDSCGARHSWESNFENRIKGRDCPFIGCCSAPKKLCPCGGGGSLLANKFPAVAAMWHPTKNLHLGKTPQTLTSSSAVVAWWRCPKEPACGKVVDHEHAWSAPVYSLTGGSGCPRCSGRDCCPCESIAATHPQLAAQWHPDNLLNADVAKEPEGRTPECFSAGSNVEVKWLCAATCPGCHREKVHVWEQPIIERAARRGQASDFCGTCPFVPCAGTAHTRKHFCECGYGSLAHVLEPTKVRWHPDKNGGRVPAASGLSPSCNDDAWFICNASPCEHAHEWNAEIRSVTASIRAGAPSAGCPFCAGLRMLEGCGCNSLAVRCPAVARQWHPTKNGSLLPTQVMARSATPVWWQCDKGGCKHACEHPHVWCVAPHKRVDASFQMSRGCPFAGCCKPPHEFCPCFSLASQPGLVKEFHPTLNGEIKPSNLSLGTATRVWWLCSASEPGATGVAHPPWLAAVGNRTGTRGSGCPTCAMPRVQTDIWNKLVELGFGVVRNFSFADDTAVDGRQKQQ